MTKKEIAERLSGALNGAELRENGKSPWSKSLRHNGRDLLDTLVGAFGLVRDRRLEELFKTAVSGDGNESRKILTLHSSSLLAFLCFSGVSRSNPVDLGGKVYTDVLFEVKNELNTTPSGQRRKPSNIDILLLGPDGRDILFLESKFTEYLDVGRVQLSRERYGRFYECLLSGGAFPFRASDAEVHHRRDENHPSAYTTNEYCLSTCPGSTGEYLAGIKQAFSHLLGIASGPVERQRCRRYNRQLLDNARSIRFGSIVFDCDAYAFSTYSELYESVFSQSGIIKEAIACVLPESRPILDKLTVEAQLFTYQNLFKQISLPERVRTFYESLWSE